MAFRGGMRRSLAEAGVWLAVAGAGASSFYFFEDVYRVVEQRWPTLQANMAGDTRTTREPARPLSGQNNAQGAAGEPRQPQELRPAVTEFDTFIEKVTQPGRSVTLNANPYGHHMVEADIGGTSVELLTDTGATYVALNYETALKLGFSQQTLRFTSRSSTANGIARVAPVTLDYIRIGSILIRDVKAVIAEPGKMTQNLLGMSFIRELAGFELRGDRLLMVQQPSQ